MAELKPCPFCGGEACVQFYPFEPAAEVVCSECGARGTAWFGEKNEERAIEAWNRRYEPKGELEFDYGAED